MKLFLCGDVMTGRGIDQILPHPADPRIHEPFLNDSRKNVELAERRSGPILRPAAFSYIWGEGLEELSHKGPDLRVVNLETSITTSDESWPGKGINYHTLDWSRTGLTDTMRALAGAGIRFAGAGADGDEAGRQAIVEVPGKGRVVLFALCDRSSGVPSGWAAAGNRPGVDLVHGHSSHHPRPLEVHSGRLILYGCGDLINDYEGINGHEEYRDELALMYFADLDQATGRLAGLTMTPLEIRRFRLQHASGSDAAWLRDTLDRRGRDFGCRVELGQDGRLHLRW